MPKSTPKVAQKVASSSPRAIDENAMLLRFRSKNSTSGVTRLTLRRAAEELGMNETALVHKALREYISRKINYKMITGIDNLEGFLERKRKETCQVPLPNTVIGRSSRM